MFEIPSIQISLFESELFGHRKGAFTDAKEDRAGIIESANSGTVFIDEIGDISLDAQAKILRVIEERRLMRIGENLERMVDVRFIFATNKDLWKEAYYGKFRKDLLHRIERFLIHIPPLRERKNEIPLIANGLWGRLTERNSSELKERGLDHEPLRNEEIEILLGYEFPGNIRQLENILVRVFRFWIDSPFSKRVEILKKEINEMRNRWEGEENKDLSVKIFEGKSLREKLLHFEKDLIIVVLRESNWNITKASEVLKISRQNLQYRIKKLGITLQEN